MLHRADVGAERVLVTGASGGVGLAAVQRAKRGGAGRTVDRGADLVEALGPGSADRDEVRPVVSRTYRLDEIARAQEDFLRKDHVGKVVLVPPPLGTER